MDEKEKASRYEQLYTDIWLFSLDMHRRNTRRIKIGITILLLLPVILGMIRWLTDSSKIAFLLIWVLCLFIVGSYLIAIEYLDDQIWKTLKEMTDKEAAFDDLLVDRRWISYRIKKVVTGMGFSTAAASIEALEKQDAYEEQEAQGADDTTSESPDIDDALIESSGADDTISESPDHDSSNDHKGGADE